jgi:hypothetical protein
LQRSLADFDAAADLTRMDQRSSAYSEIKSGGFPIRRIYENISRGGLKHRAPVFVAILSVAFQQYPYLGDSGDLLSVFSPKYSLILLALVVSLAFLSLFATTSRFAIVLFTACAVINTIPRWTFLANHSFLALWSIPVAGLFKEWWESDLYALYLRVTISIVMFAAAAQKLLAGTYIDGSYIYWLTSHGSVTERLFWFACDNTSGVPCLNIKIISIFILCWQLVVGILLLLGVRSLVFLAVEIGFLLGAGIFADEMNFQVLNIALLCIIFRIGMPMWLVLLCVTLLYMDVYTISYLTKLLVQHVY